MVCLAGVSRGELFLHGYFSSSLSKCVATLLHGDVVRCASRFCSRFVGFNCRSDGRISFTVRFATGNIAKFVVSVLCAGARASVAALTTGVGGCVFGELIGE